MKMLVLIAALILTAAPAAAQVATPNGQQPNGQQQSVGQGGLTTSAPQLRGGQVGQSAPPQAPTTGVICIEEMTATFCNVPTGPNTSGYGSGGGIGSSSAAGSNAGSASSAGAGANTSSIPPCADFPPANQLCN